MDTIAKNQAVDMTENSGSDKKATVNWFARV